MGWRKGNVIMKAEPYVHVLSNKYRLERCSFCLRRLDTKQCGACKIVRYCSRNCQKEDWAVHRQECQCLRRAAPYTPTDSVLLLLRLLIKHSQESDTVVNGMDPGIRTFQQLMSHTEEIKKDAARCDAFSQISFTLTKMTGPDLPLPDPATLLDIFGKMVINTFTIADQEMQDIGSGLYLSPACLDHCCTPNAAVTFQGKTLTVRAVQDIPSADLSNVSETVFLSYVDQLAPSWERQQQLQQQYYFLCQCPRCGDTSLDRAMTSGTHSASSDQGNHSDDEAVDAAIKACQNTIATAEGVKKSTGDADEILRLSAACLTKVKAVLSASSVCVLRLLDLAFDAAITAALWEQALDYGTRTLEPYRRLLPPFSPALGLQLMRVGKLQLWLDRMDAAHRSLAQAEAILAVTHGKDSELYAQLTELLMQTSCSLGANASSSELAAIDTS